MYLQELRVLGEAKHSATSFMLVQRPVVLGSHYLVAEPDDLPDLGHHTNLLPLEAVHAEQNTRWLEAPVPIGPDLATLLAESTLTDLDLIACWIDVAEALVHIAARRPDLLPGALHPAQIRRLGNGRWVLDLPGLALTPGMVLGSGANVIKAFGMALHQIMGDEAAPEASGPPRRPFSPALRYLMLRCQWGGLASLHEVRDALRQLQGQATSPEPPVRPAFQPSTRPAPQAGPSPVAIYLQRVSAAGSAPAITQDAQVGFRLALVGLVTSCLMLLFAIDHYRFQRSLVDGAPIPTSTEHQGAPAALVPSVGQEPATAGLGNSVQPPGHHDQLSAEPVFTVPVATAPLVMTPVGPALPAAPPPPAPSPPSAGPSDPVMARDLWAAGPNLVTITLFDHPIGQAYMFTNPGAAVISLERLSALLQRQITWTLLPEGRLELRTTGRTFTTTHFLTLEGRIWLILKPDLIAEFGYRVVEYGDGRLRLELRN